MNTINELMEKLPKERQQRIKVRAEELIGEELTLRDLRKAHKLTQKNIAKALGIGQEGVSRLEQRSDLLLSTLNQYIHAMGGELQLVAKFPKRPPIILKGIGKLE